MKQACDRIVPDGYIPVLAYMEETGVFLCDDGHIGVCYWGNPVSGADDTTVDMLKGAFSLSPSRAASFRFHCSACPTLMPRLPTIVRAVKAVCTTSRALLRVRH